MADRFQPAYYRCAASVCWSVVCWHDVQTVWLGALVVFVLSSSSPTIPKQTIGQLFLACQRKPTGHDVHHSWLRRTYFALLWRSWESLWGQRYPLQGPWPHRTRVKSRGKDGGDEHEGVHGSCVGRLQEDEKWASRPATLPHGTQYGRPHCLDGCLDQPCPLWWPALDRPLSTRVRSFYLGDSSISPPQGRGQPSQQGNKQRLQQNLSNVQPPFPQVTILSKSSFTDFRLLSQTWCWESCQLESMADPLFYHGGYKFGAAQVYDIFILYI